MIPFEEEASLTETEGYVEGLLRSQWDYVVRSTPGVKEDLEGKFPELSSEVSRRIVDDSDSRFSNIFRPGVPDFMAFDDSGDYLFVEAKSESDNLRHSQLKWLRDFSGVNVEIWFADSDRDVEKLGEEELNSYGFQDVKKDSSDRKVEEGLKVELPEDFSAILGLEEGDSVNWRLKSSDELILDTR